MKIQVKKSGLTLIELTIVLVMFAILIGVSTYIFRVVLLSWSGQETRAGININIDRGIEEMVRELREAQGVYDNYDGDGTPNDEIRVTQNGSTYYIYYFYNSSDSYGPPPAFTQSSYELRRATLSGGLNTNFASYYGSGRIIATDVLPPTTSDLSVSGNIATIDLSIRRDDETIRSRTQIKPRNL